MTVDPVALGGLIVLLLSNLVTIVWNIATVKSTATKTEQAVERIEAVQRVHDTDIGVLKSRLDTDIEELKVHRQRVHEFNNTVMKGFFDVIEELRDTLEKFRNEPPRRGGRGE